MRAHTFHILHALRDGPLDGQGIIRRADQDSLGRVRLSAGTLYGALERLSDDGKIIAGDHTFDGGRPRREYALSDYGRRVLEDEATHHMEPPPSHRLRLPGRRRRG